VTAASGKEARRAAMRDWRNPALLPNARFASVADAGENDEGSGLDLGQASPKEQLGGGSSNPRADFDAMMQERESELDEIKLSGHLHILVESASNLPDKTKLLQKDRPSPLAQVTFGANSMQSTKVVESTNAPRWNEELVWCNVTVGGPLEPTFPLAVQVFSEGWGMGRLSLIGIHMYTCRMY